MKRFLATLGAGIIIGVIAAPEWGRKIRRRLFGSRPVRQRYQWRDPDDRLAIARPEIREKMMDKTLADSFPASDPPSSIPDPSADSIVA